MAIYSIYILSKSGGLIFQYDHTVSKTENERTWNYPLDIQLAEQNKRIVVAFGQKDGIQPGHTLLAVNGIPLNGNVLEDGREVISVLGDQSNFPISLKFGRPKLSTNEKIFLGKYEAVFPFRLNVISNFYSFSKYVLSIVCYCKSTES